MLFDGKYSTPFVTDFTYVYKKYKKGLTIEFKAPNGLEEKLLDGKWSHWFPIQNAHAWFLRKWRIGNIIYR